MEQKPIKIYFETPEDNAAFQEEMGNMLVEAIKSGYSRGKWVGIIIGLATAVAVTLLSHVVKADEITKAAMTSGAMYQIDPNLILAIAKVESNLNPMQVGALKEVGLMQVRPEYYPVTFEVHNNIQVGTKLLAQVKARCKHKEDLTFVVCYNAGITGGSRIKNPKANAYYKKVVKALREMKGASYVSKN